MSAEIEKRVEAQGVHLKFGATIDHMEQEDGKKIAVLTDGSRISADIVGLCIGTRAITDPVKDEVAIVRGITETLIKAKIPCEETGIRVCHTVRAICSPANNCGVNAYVRDGRMGLQPGQRL